MSVSERLAQEDTILREIRLSLNTFRTTMGKTTSRRKGAVYVSSPITSGLRLYDAMWRLGLKSYEEFKTREGEKFLELVMRPNLRDGARFGELIRSEGWPLVIVPGELFAKGWAQEHYMSLWRQVIVRYARTVDFNGTWHWSTGCVEEFLIAIQSGKRILFGTRPYAARQGADLIRTTMDEIDKRGFDPKPLYDLWRQIQLTLDATTPQEKTT